MFFPKNSLTTLNALGTVVITLLVVILISVILGNSEEKLVSTVEDLACRTYLESYNSLVGQSLAFKDRYNQESKFFGEFTRYCKTEKILIEETEKEKIYQEISETTRKCWNRFGSGELKFLDFTQREGSYCFVCATINFEDEDLEVAYSNSDLGRWMDNEIPKDKNEENLNYRELSNFFYTDFTQNSENLHIESFRDDLANSLTLEKYEEYRPLLIEVSELFNYLYGVEYRTITPQETQFVVYRYNLDDSSFETAATQVAVGVATGAALRFGAKRIACYAAAGIVAATGVGAPAGAAIAVGCTGAGVLGAGKTVQKGAEAYDKVTDIQKNVGKFYPKTLSRKDSAEFKKYVSWLDNNLELKKYVASGGKIKIPKKIETKLRGTKEYDELVKLYDDINAGNFKGKEIEPATLKQIVKLVSAVIALDAMLAIENGALPDFSQYVEIVPESEFYELCGTVPNYEN